MLDSRKFLSLPASEPEPEPDPEEVVKYTNYSAWFEQEVREGNKEIEVVPPWECAPGYPPWSMAWRQGNGEGWIVYEWYPYWAKLTKEERAAYLEKWNVPDDWRTHIERPSFNQMLGIDNTEE